ncbi:MAG: hypothetical protein KDD11_18950, partial [Acidobacteria bacterium]|nr:hypothetical protein [Acidobacteriota bacterium]
MHKEPREAQLVHTEPVAGPARLVRATVARPPGAEAEAPFRRGDRWSLDVEWETRDANLRFHLAIGIDRIDSVQIASFSTLHDGLEPFAGRTRYRVRLSLSQIPMIQGEYSVFVYLLDEYALHAFDSKVVHAAFRVITDEYRIGLLHVPHRWDAEASEPPAPAAPSGESLETLAA